jgi:hypothetical protein
MASVTRVPIGGPAIPQPTFSRITAGAQRICTEEPNALPPLIVNSMLILTILAACACAANFRLFNYVKSFESYLDAGSVMFYAKRFFAVFLVVFGLGAASAGASVLVTVDRDDQLMRVYVEGDLIYVWPVSTGRMGYRTPAGRYSPTILRRMHYSRKYDYAPMPYAIFFRGGYAIHGTYSVGRLGRQASHGCIRLHPANARELFQMVQDYGPGDTRIVIR